MVSSAPEPHLEAPPAYDDDDSYLYGVVSNAKAQ